MEYQLIVTGQDGEKPLPVAFISEGGKTPSL